MRSIPILALLAACASADMSVVADAAAPAPPPDAAAPPIDAAPPPDAEEPDAAASTGCAMPEGREAFSAVMVGCPGAVPWANRETLCAPGYQVCTASWWVALRSGAAPTHSYWTDDELRYTGTSTACAALEAGGTACPADVPMRVCAGAMDPEGNTCTWSGCGFVDSAPPEYFGGCFGNTTAGALCCRAPCADGTSEDELGGGMFGCSGAVAWDDRASLCGEGYHVCSASEWVTGHGGAAPSNSYWTDDELQHTGEASACAAVLSGGTACAPGRPMRVCSGATDTEGNTCTWMNCGYETVTPDRFFGGCNNDATAGALCCVD